MKTPDFSPQMGEWGSFFAAKAQGAAEPQSHAAPTELDSVWIGILQICPPYGLC
jgi:hypothetical protein